MKHIKQLLSLAVGLAAAFTLSAQVPETISYQGRVTVAGTNFTGPGQFKFALVDSGTAVTNYKATATHTFGTFGKITSVSVTYGGTGYWTPPLVRAVDPLRLGSGATFTASVAGGQVTGVTVNSQGNNYSAQTYIDIAAPPAQIAYVTYWSHDGTSAQGAEPTSAVTLPVNGGLVSVLLGNPTLTNMNPLPASVFTNADARLRLWFNDGVQGFSQLSPDQPLGAVGYAMMAAGLPPGAITAQNIAVGTIGSNQLAAGSVNSSHLAGTLPEAVLSTNVALRLGGNAFSGDQTVMSGELGIGTLSPDGTLDVRTKIISQGASGNHHTNLVFKKTAALGSANAEMVFSHRSSGTELWLYGNNGINGLRNLQGWHYASNAVSFPAGGQTLYIDEGLGRVGVGRKPVADALEVEGDMSVSDMITGLRLKIGLDQSLSGSYATIAGGRENTNSGLYATIAGGYRNTLAASYATVGGGSGNTANTFSVVAGGRDNVASGTNATIAGGLENTNSGSCATIAGGQRNTVDASYATVGGGSDNTADSIYAAVSGGRGNVANSGYATVAGGWAGVASGPYSTVVGGSHNNAQGSYSLAAGYYATAAHNNSFIWNGQSVGGQTTTGENRFEVHAPGGARFYTGTNAFYASGDMSCDTLTIRGGADLAEPFAVSGDNILAGSVVVIDEQNPGRLKLSTTACDTKVAGIVSGAGGVQPGISMIQQDTLEGGRNVALSGRVYVWVDASKSPVRPGDLLTTSDTPGHAMKAVNPAQAQGAILGKAMTPLSGGRGLVLVLVSLQ